MREENRTQEEYAPYSSYAGSPTAPAYVEESAPVETADSFEPDDPIPEKEEKPEKRRFPKFVDFFMKKNGDDNSNLE
jgi:hypothetical protein